MQSRRGERITRRRDDRVAGRRAEGETGPWTGRAELEELSFQPAREYRSARLGLGGTLAITAAAGLLAAGFGLFGGRPSPTTTSSTRATSGPAAGAPTGVLAGYESPRVTPALPCGAPPAQVPRVLLVVDGAATPGRVEALPAAGGAGQTGSATGSSPPAGLRVDVPVDVTTEVWIADRACAHAWTMELGRPCEEPGCGVVLDALHNSELRPGYASQNRFRVDIVGPGGWFSNRAEEEVELRAILSFPDFVALATWPIRIRGIELPAVTLGSGDAEAFTIMGCDVSVTLRNGSVQSYAESGCRESIRLGEEAAPLVVAPAAALTFRFGEWLIDTANVACGHLYLASFTGPDAACGLAPGNYIGTVEFAGPRVAGSWTLAIEGCAEQERGGGNRICGTWYAQVEVGD